MNACALIIVSFQTTMTMGYYSQFPEIIPHSWACYLCITELCAELALKLAC